MPIVVKYKELRRGYYVTVFWHRVDARTAHFKRKAIRQVIARSIQRERMTKASAKLP